MFKLPTVLFCWFVGHFTPCFALQLVVDPNVSGGFDTIQPALDAAAPGQYILVMPGVYHGPLVISKPVTLLGVDMPEIRHKSIGGQQWRCVELNGTGTGRVVIAGFKIGLALCNTWVAYPGRPGISGTGFDELHVMRCQVQGPTWSALTGVAFGIPALTATIPLVVISHSDLQGSATVDDLGWYPLPQAPPSVDVNGTVAILDSVILGSPAQDVNLSQLWGPPPPQPCPCPEMSTKGVGGPGVKATLGIVVNSTISGGTGAKIEIYDQSTSLWVPYGQQPSGPAWTPDSTSYEMQAVGLDAPLPMRIGQPWSLTYPPEWSGATIYASFNISTPYAFGGQFAFLQTADAAWVLSAGTTSIDLTWPDSMALIGMEIVWQLHDPVLGLSRPVFDIMMP